MIIKRINKLVCMVLLCLVGFLSAFPLQAETKKSYSIKDIFSVPYHSSAFADDSTASHFNPASLAVNRDFEMSYFVNYRFEEHKNGSKTTVKDNLIDPNRGLFIKAGVPSLGRIANSFGFHYAHLEDYLPGTDPKTMSYHKFQIANGTRFGNRFYGGFNYTIFKKDGASSPYNNLQTLALGLLFRPNAHFSLGFVIRDINRPEFNLHSTDFPETRLNRRYELGIAFRPFSHRFTFQTDLFLNSLFFTEPTDRRTNSALAVSFNFEPTPGLKFFVSANNQGNWDSNKDRKFNDMPFNIQSGLTLVFGKSHFQWDNYVSVSDQFDPRFGEELNHIAGMGGRFTSMQHPAITGKRPNYLLISIDDAIQEEPSGDPFAFLADGEEPSYFIKYLILIKKAAVDPKVSGIVLHINQQGLGLAQIQELRNVLQFAKKNDKRIVAYLETANAGDYYLASVADEIYLYPLANIELRGLFTQVFFLKGLFDKIGIHFEAYTTGANKTAPNQLTEDKFTDEHREVITYLLENLHTTMVHDVAKDRNIAEKDLQNIIDQAPIFPEDAVKQKLVTGMKRFEEIKKQFNPIELNEYIANNEYEPSWEIPSSLAILYITGQIVTGSSTDGFMLFDKSVGDDTIVEAIETIQDSQNIKGVMVRIDSGGGSGIASDRIAYALKKLSETKPVIVSMGNTAASGGYYVAMGAQKIVASPTTLTGSIGVFSVRPNYSELLEKIGITYDEVKMGKNAGLWQTPKPLNDEQKAVMQREIDQFYAKFLQIVSENRPITLEELKPIANGGKVWLGKDAATVKLVDDLGGFEQALALLKEYTHIKPNEKYNLVFLPKSSMNFVSMMQSMAKMDQGFTQFVKQLYRIREREIWLMNPSIPN